jgi:hypothetical protein
MLNNALHTKRRVYSVLNSMPASVSSGGRRVGQELSDIEIARLPAANEQMPRSYFGEISCCCVGFSEEPNDCGACGQRRHTVSNALLVTKRSAFM